MKHGKGKYTKNGGIYEGDWKNGKANGFGIYLYSDGSRYEGHWKNHMKHGKGELK